MTVKKTNTLLSKVTRDFLVSKSINQLAELYDIDKWNGDQYLQNGIRLMAYSIEYECIQLNLVSERNAIQWEKIATIIHHRYIK